MRGCEAQTIKEEEKRSTGSSSATVRRRRVDRTWSRSLRTFARAFVLATSIKAGAVLVKDLLPLLRRRGRRNSLTVVLTGMARKGFAEMVDPDTFRFACFLGGICGGFNAGLCVFGNALRRWRGRRGGTDRPSYVPGDGIGDKVCTAAAGFLCGASLLLTGPRASWRPVFVLFSAVKATEYLCAALQQRRLLPPVPHVDVLLFSIACTDIMFSWFYHPERLPPSYNRWITLMADMDPRLLKGLRALHHKTARYGTKSDILRSYCIDHGLDPARGDLVTFIPVPNDVVHPDAPHSSLVAVWNRWRRGFLRAAALYGPVHVLPLLIFKARLLVQHPLEALRRVVFAVARSSAFLGTFIASIWATIIVTRRARGMDTALGPLLGSMVCGLSLLVEKKSRRLELALYVLPRALQTAIFSSPTTAQLWSRFHGVVFCAATAAVGLCYVHEPENIRPSQYWLFRQFLD